MCLRLAHPDGPGFGTEHTPHSEATTRRVLGHLTSGRGCVVVVRMIWDLPFTETQREVALVASSQHQEVQAHLMTSNPWGPGLRGKGAAHRSIDHTPRPPRPASPSRKVSEKCNIS